MTASREHPEDGIDEQLHAQASDQARIFQAGRDQHIAERDLHLHYEDGVRRLRRAATRIEHAQCPYPGLTAFDSTQSHWFFGRDMVTAELLVRLDQRLHDGGPLVVVAPSGAGKSSLLRAGLLAAIENGALPAAGSSHWPRLVFTPTAEPLAVLTTQLAARLDIDARRLQASLQAGTGAYAALVRDTLHRRTDAGREGDSRLVVVVDQIEELFTLCPSERKQHTFLDVVSKLAAAGPSGEPPAALAVYGLRSDFYTPCANYPQLREALRQGQVLLGPLTEEGVREAILFPARAVGLEVEPGLVEILVRDLGTTSQDPNSRTDLPERDSVGAYEAGRLPLLAHALRAIWQARHGQTLTVEGYQSTGGIARAVATTAERLFTTLDPAAQAASRDVFLRLVKIGEGVDDARRRVAYADAVSQADEAVAVIGAFTQGRLLTREGDGVEITHEVLLRAWPRLRQWIDADRTGHLIRQELEEDAGAWHHSHRDASLLYRGSRLERAHEWSQESNKARMSTVAADFITASLRQRRRTVRTRRAVIAVLSVLTLIASSAAVVAFHQRSVARSERDAVILHRLMAQADALRDTQPSLATQIDLAAYHRPGGADQADLASELITAAGTPQAVSLKGHREVVNSVAFSPNGQLLASADGSGAIRLWDLVKAPHVTSREIPQAGEETKWTISFSPDGRTLVSGGSGGRVRLWDLADPQHPKVREPLHAVTGGASRSTAAVFSADFSPDGGTLVAVSDGIWLWDMTRRDTPQLLKRLPNTTDNEAVFSPDGKVLATAGDARLRLWNVADPAKPKPLGPPLTQPYPRPYDEHKNGVISLAFSPDGRTLASADQDVRLWNVSDPARPKQRPKYIVGHDEAINSIEFSPDSQMLATVGKDPVVQLWNVSDPNNPLPRMEPLRGHHKFHENLDVTFSVNGERMASASRSREILLWNIPNAFINVHAGTAVSMSSHPKKEVLASSSSDGTVRLWSVPPSGRARHVGAPLRDPGLTEGEFMPTLVEFSADGRLLAVAGGDDSRNAVRLWDTSDLTEPKPMGAIYSHGQFDAAVSLAFSPKEATLVVADENSVTLFDISHPSSPRQVGKPLVGAADSGSGDSEPAVFSLSFSPDGKLLAGVDSSYLRLWDMNDPVHPKEFEKTSTQGEGLTSAVFMPHGRILAASDFDGTIQLWECDDPTHLIRIGQSLVGHQDGVLSMAFSPSGRTLASGSDDQTLRLWDVSSLDHPRPLGQSITGHSRSVFSLAFISDGWTLVSSGNDATTRLWQTDADRAVQRICQSVGNTLTKAEWKRYVPELPYRPNCSEADHGAAGQ